MSDPLVPYSGEWIRKQTDEELDYLINGAMPGQTLDALVTEASRRAAVAAEKQQMLWIKRTFWAAMIIGVAGIAATVLR